MGVWYGIYVTRCRNICQLFVTEKEVDGCNITKRYKGKAAMALINFVAF